MSDYIISEELYLSLRSILYNTGYIDKYHQLKHESRPLSDHDAEIRKKVLDELEQIAQHNWEEIETDEGEMIRMCFCGELIGKIEELRGEQ